MVGHIVELCPQTNLRVGVYIAAATIRLFFQQTVLAIQYTDTFTQSSLRSLNGLQKVVTPIYR